jgi:hypothetical protein
MCSLVSLFDEFKRRLEGGKVYENEPVLRDGFVQEFMECSEKLEISAK